MTKYDAEIRQHLRLREDSAWGFKQVVFDGDHPASPLRDELADEMAAFANANGGVLLCGITEDSRVQGMSPEQMTALNNLLVEVSVDAVKPALHLGIHHRELDGKAFVLVEVPRGDTVHEREGKAFIRIGASKRPLDGEERVRLMHNRAQGRYLCFDNQIVPQTGFESLSEPLWLPLLSVSGAADPRRGLMNLRLLAQDEAGVDRATVAGVLLCAHYPQEWLPYATILAACYRGQDRASGQVDAQEISGSLQKQVAEAMKFVVRNMRVSARKVPQWEDVAQYSKAAVFEAVVNAVAHRDYSMSSRRIRLSMFKDRLEINSPGTLPNDMNIEGMDASQATRNEVIASVFGRIPVVAIPGADNRGVLMERRGDGVSIILKKTQEATGILPQYQIVDESSLVLSIPSAKLELSPADSTVTVHSKGEPLSGVEILAFYPNKTWKRAITDGAGEVNLNLYTTHLPMTVYAAAPEYSAGLVWQWLPSKGGLLMELKPLPTGGATICPSGTGNLPGLRGRLNPIRDTYDRTYLYADNISIEEGRQQPVYFRLGKSMSLTDAYGTDLSVTIIDIIGRSALVEYQSLE